MKTHILRILLTLSVLSIAEGQKRVISESGDQGTVIESFTYLPPDFGISVTIPEKTKLTGLFLLPANKIDKYMHLVGPRFDTSLGSISFGTTSIRVEGKLEESAQLHREHLLADYPSIWRKTKETSQLLIVNGIEMVRMEINWVTSNEGADHVVYYLKTPNGRLAYIHLENPFDHFNHPKELENHIQKTIKRSNKTVM